MITIRALTKEYGSVRAVDGLTFDIEPGRVTGFLGPNGAGKSTTMRLILGLDRPTSGSALIRGKRYTELSQPLREVGALLDAGAVHPGRTGRAHLRVAALSNGLPAGRVDEVLDLVGLGSAVARRRIKTYSLGMRQRLGIASALLGDPEVLLFDEPINGLDVEGVRWLRDLLRRLADDGRTVLVSSHLMSEMELVADRVVIIGRGRLLADSRLMSPGTGTVLARNAAAEWHRLWTVRSSWLLAFLLALAGIGLATVVSLELADSAQPGGSPWVIAQILALVTLFGLIVFAALGTTSDHATRSIVPTLQWTPRRPVLLAARAGTLTITSTLVGLVIIVAASAIVWAVVPDLRFFTDDGARAVGACASVFATGTALTIGLGLATRSTAGTLAAAFAAMLVLPLLLQLAPFDWVTQVIELLPGAGALYLLVGEGPGDTQMSALSSSLTLCGWAVGALAAGAWRFLYTDADK